MMKQCLSLTVRAALGSASLLVGCSKGPDTIAEAEKAEKGRPSVATGKDAQKEVAHKTE